MVSTEIIPDLSPQDELSDFPTLYDELKDKRHWVNLTTVTDTAFDVEVTLKDQLFAISATTAVAGVNLPASNAASAGMSVRFVVDDATNTVTIARDGSDTINGSAADLTPSLYGKGELISMGDGNWTSTSGPTVAISDVTVDQELNMGAHSVYFTEQTITSSGGAASINWDLGNKAAITLTEATTISFSDTGGAASLTIKVTQDGTGSRTITWPVATLWSGGSVPTLTAAAGSVDIITLYFDGTTYYGASVLNFS